MDESQDILQDARTDSATSRAPSSQASLEASLEASDARYRHLVESASDGIYRIDPAGFFLYANPVMARVLGARDGLIGRHYLEFVRSDAHDEIQRFYVRQIAQQVPVTYYEFPAATPDGSDLWIGQQVQTELDAQGNLVALHAVARDITERKRLEEELRQADKMRVVGQLAGGIAHDFNSILTAIRGFADLLINALGPLDERTSDAIEIRKAADKAARLTSQLLTFSRRETVRPQQLDVRAVIHEIRPMLQQLLGSTVAFELDFVEELGTVHADPGQLEQVILNFALNARDAMPDGGTLTLRVARKTVVPDEELAEVLFPGRYVLLEVIDTGIGMDEATRDKIFEPFFTTKAPGQGTGLGLSTTHGIITQAGGWIGVESAPGKGTTFSVYLPERDDVAVNPFMPPQPNDHASPNKGVVLVADDEDGILAVITRVLEADGYRVITAANGTEALNKSRQYHGPIDLLLTDLVMPQMGGFELAQQIATERPQAKVLFMSGYVDATRLDPHVAQRIRLVHKPFKNKTMLAEVRSIVPAPLQNFSAL